MSANLQKTLEVEEGRTVTFRASALTPHVYKKVLGRDFFKDLEDFSRMEELSKSIDQNEERNDETKTAAPAELNLETKDYDAFMRMAYCMAYQGAGDREARNQFINKYPDMWEWLDSFQTFSLFKILPVIVELWGANAEATVKAKNAHPAPPEK